MQLTTNFIKKAEQGVNGLVAKLGAPADLSQHSPHASVQQLLNAGSALGNLQASLSTLRVRVMLLLYIMFTRMADSCIC